jgi:uridine kinase
MWFLSKFKKEELNIINEDEEFVSIKKYLHNELKNIDNDAVEFVDINQLDAELEATVREYED